MKALLLSSVLFILTVVPPATADTNDGFVAKFVGEPVVAGVYNAASWIPEGLPGHGIAQGSIFAVTGWDIGPDPLLSPGTLPLTTVMEKTSIEVTVGGMTANALMVYTWTHQLAAVLPSTMPVGQGTLTVTYDGATSAPFPIRVVSSAFGIFTGNASGFGPAIVQNWIGQVELRLNSLIDSAVESQSEIIWGTGLGAISGDDSVAPPCGVDLDADVQVLVGGKIASLISKGRSCGFPGIDHVQFRVPSGVEGCYVPVTVIADGVVSNFGTMSINTSGGSCSDAVSFSAADLEPLVQGQESRLGGIVLTGIDFSAPDVTEELGMWGASASFGAIPPLSVLQSLGPMGFLMSVPSTSMGACHVYQGLGSELEIDHRAPGTGLDVGEAMNMVAPFGMMGMVLDDSGYYIEEAEEAEENLIVPGLYTFDNGAGGVDVGEFEASLMVPVSQFNWTNRDTIESISRSEDLTVTWTGGNDSQEVVVIIGYSARTDLGVMGSIVCAERVSAGQFTLPAWQLSALPVSTPWDMEQDEGQPSGLIVGRMSRFDQNRLAASGLDAGLLFYVLADYRIVPYQ